MPRPISVAHKPAKAAGSQDERGCEARLVFIGVIVCSLVGEYPMSPEWLHGRLSVQQGGDAAIAAYGQVERPENKRICQLRRAIASACTKC